ncbi:MAG: HAMP domain-containing sensor histidine kinase, partial [Gammaproteobacteria bacterium]|nr:HAMP domain-containing sensor histidine kinase [Gammaproteobacteria bacterium]
DGTSYAFLVIPKGVSLWGSNATFIGLLLVAITVIVSVAWLIARTISRPVSELQMAVRELASGDIGVRVPESISSRNDELGALAADFNRMAGRLQQLIEGRESLFQEMSHELRSPLARLQAAIELAAERNESPVSQRGQIELEIARMNRVIGEMLRYSSLDNQVTVKQQLFRVNRRLKDIVATEQVEASNAGCELQLDAEAELTMIGDPELIGRGFENIIRNAIRFAPADSCVSIQAWRESNAAGQPQITVTVKDSGPGIDAEQLQRVFEPYVKLNAGQNSQPSTGLGLAIVKRVVEHHHGSVTAENRDGGGLCVTVRLPAAELS